MLGVGKGSGATPIAFISGYPRILEMLIE